MGFPQLAFSLPGHVLRLVENVPFMKLVDYSLFNFAEALSAFKILQMINWSESSCVSWFPYFFAEGAVE